MISCLTLRTLKSNDLLWPGSATSSLINLLKSIRLFIAFSLVFSIFFFLAFSYFLSAFSSFGSAVSEDFFFRFLIGLINIISLALIFFLLFLFVSLRYYTWHITFDFYFCFCFFSFALVWLWVFLRQVMYLLDKLLFLL